MTCAKTICFHENMFFDRFQPSGFCHMKTQCENLSNIMDSPSTRKIRSCFWAKNSKSWKNHAYLFFIFIIRGCVQIFSSQLAIWFFSISDELFRIYQEEMSIGQVHRWNPYCRAGWPGDWPLRGRNKLAILVRVVSGFFKVARTTSHRAYPGARYVEISRIFSNSQKQKS